MTICQVYRGARASVKRTLVHLINSVLYQVHSIILYLSPPNPAPPQPGTLLHTFKFYRSTDACRFDFALQTEFGRQQLTFMYSDWFYWVKLTISESDKFLYQPLYYLIRTFSMMSLNYYSMDLQMFPRTIGRSMTGIVLWLLVFLSGL